ncbi:hypothetical protein L598_007800000040 [Mesorhizobium sp. J18]|uniref:hypothetical protein n=1 Tax=Mesorhizobium sp. J18 TaxID=935263 RepID=UPI001199A670|nr:hypothetical protein [Mesorhizobium sp. J18]TWG89837.1 hypothetical protein L598_007800000040 [Mesorhizobium sp. J18]
MLGGLSGLLGGVGSLLRGVHDVVNDVAETVSPGSTSAFTTTGNLIADDGLLGDLITGVEQGDLIGGIANSYGNIVGPGGVINNLADGHGLGVESLLGNTLGTADGVLDTVDGLLGGATDGLLGGVTGDDGLLGGVLGGGLLGDGLLGSDGGLLDGVLGDGGLLG